MKTYTLEEASQVGAELKEKRDAANDHTHIECPDCGRDWGHGYCGTCKGTRNVAKSVAVYHDFHAHARTSEAPEVIEHLVDENRRLREACDLFERNSEHATRIWELLKEVEDQGCAPPDLRYAIREAVYGKKPPVDHVAALRTRLDAAVKACEAFVTAWEKSHQLEKTDGTGQPYRDVLEQNRT